MTSQLESTSSSLLARVRSQDQAAWERLATIFGPLVYQWCRQCDLQPDDAADVDQEVFRSLVSSIGTFQHDGSGSFRGWLWTITRNKIRDAARRRRNRPDAVGGSAIQERLLALPEPSEQDLFQDDSPNDEQRLLHVALELIRDESTLNVRILTRSPLARADFDLFKSFGKRLVFGMSLPTLRNDLAKVYEPKAPAPSQRLATLHAAKDAGLHVYVAVAPTYPECDETDLRTTLKAVAELKPITIFHEPINIRAENVARIEEQAESVGVPLKTEVFATRESWQDYAVSALHTVSELAKELGISKRLHLWPDKSLGSQSLVERMSKPQKYQERLEHWWNRISEWPK